jgi:acyl-CoA synthetase (AMP-forming)/AMP-acid ligase II
MLTHGIMMAQTLAYFAEIEPVGYGDCVLHAAPMSHGSGCYGLPYVAMGANTVIPESAGFDPEEIAALLSAHGNVSFFAAPTMVSRLINHCRLRRRRSPRPAHHHLWRRADAFRNAAPRHGLLGPKFAQIYGQGEVPMTITALSKDIHADRARPRWREIMGSVGLPRANVEVRVAMTR